MSSASGSNSARARQIAVQPGEDGRECRAVGTVAQVGVEKLAVGVLEWSVGALEWSVVGALESSPGVLGQPLPDEAARRSARSCQDCRGQVRGDLGGRALVTLTRQSMDQAAGGAVRRVRQRTRPLARRQGPVEQRFETIDKLRAAHLHQPRAPVRLA